MQSLKPFFLEYSRKKKNRCVTLSRTEAVVGVSLSADVLRRGVVGPGVCWPSDLSRMRRRCCRSTSCCCNICWWRLLMATSGAGASVPPASTPMSLAPGEGKGTFSRVSIVPSLLLVVLSLSAFCWNIQQFFAIKFNLFIFISRFCDVQIKSFLFTDFIAKSKLCRKIYYKSFSASYPFVKDSLLDLIFSIQTRLL